MRCAAGFLSGLPARTQKIIRGHNPALLKSDLDYDERSFIAIRLCEV